MEEQQLQVVEPQRQMAVFGSERPADIVNRATEVANVLAPIVEQKKLYKIIGPKKHVYAEGWTAMLSLIGVFPISEYSRRIEREGEIAYEARVVLKTLGGVVVGAGEAICSSKERNWAQRDEYAIKSMAQTRATGKACRLPFSWIMTLAGYEATPAEEMDGIEVRSTVQPPRPKSVPGPVHVDTTSDFSEPDPYGGNPPEQASAPGAAKGISKKQQALIFVKAKQANIPENVLRAHLKATYAVEHTAELNWKAMDPLLAWIEQYAQLSQTGN